MFVIVALRYITCLEHGLPGSARNHLCPGKYGPFSRGRVGVVISVMFCGAFGRVWQCYSQVRVKYASRSSRI